MRLNALKLLSSKGNVSIPYRFNETINGYGDNKNLVLFQFIIVSMRLLQKEHEEKRIYVSIPYRFNETFLCVYCIRRLL